MVRHHRYWYWVTCRSPRSLYIMTCNTWMLTQCKNIADKTTRGLQSPREQLRVFNMFDSLRLPIGNPHFRFGINLKAQKCMREIPKDSWKPFSSFVSFRYWRCPIPKQHNWSPSLGKGEDPGSMPYPSWPPRWDHLGTAYRTFCAAGGEQLSLWNPPWKILSERAWN